MTFDQLADCIAWVKLENKKNLWRMKQFYETYKDNEKLSTLLRDLSWPNNLLIINHCKTDEEREY